MRAGWLLRSCALRAAHLAALLLGALCEWGRAAGLRLAPPSPPLSTPPSHLGVVIGEGELRGPLEVAAVARLIGWCAGAGVRTLTLCDVRGYLAASPHALADALLATGVTDTTPTVYHQSKALSSEGGNERASPEKPLVARISGWGGCEIQIVNSQTGRDDIVGAARRLCAKVADGQLAAEAIDETAMSQELMVNSGFPDPVPPYIASVSGRACQHPTPLP
ncbi:MAG: hypothetical protein SGPRY_006228 [Prymnesium sp.]